MKNNLLMLGFILLSVAAQADKGTNFKVEKEAPTNLIDESNRLKLEEETTVQRQATKGEIDSVVCVGVIQPTSLIVNTQGRIINHSFDQALPMASAQFSGFPNRKTSKWGWLLSIGYSYSETPDSPMVPATALHLIPIKAGAVYRFQNKDTQKFVPFLSAGPNFVSYIQRGSSEQ